MREALVFFNHTETFVEADAFCAKGPGEPLKHHNDPALQWSAWLDHALTPLLAHGSGGRDKDSVCQWVSVFQTQCVQESSTCCLSAEHLVSEKTPTPYMHACFVSDYVARMDMACSAYNIQTAYIIGHPYVMACNTCRAYCVVPRCAHARSHCAQGYAWNA